jgi:hypothetical protein
MTAAAQEWAAAQALPPDEANLLGVMAHYAYTTAGRRVVCRVEQPLLVKATGLSRPVVLKLLTSLETRGLLSWERGQHGPVPTTYTLNLPAGVAS